MFVPPRNFSSNRISRRGTYPRLGWEVPVEPMTNNRIPLNHGRTDFPMPRLGAAIFPKDPTVRSQQRRIYAVKPEINRPAEDSVPFYQMSSATIAMAEAWKLLNTPKPSRAVKRPRFSSGRPC